MSLFLNNAKLTILHYSINHLSLNIKLDSKSSESKAILEKEKTLINKAKQTNKDSISTALLHPILENDILKCPHNGIVKLKSIKGKPFKSHNSPMILESDLIDASIICCTNLRNTVMIV